MPSHHGRGQAGLVGTSTACEIAAMHRPPNAAKDTVRVFDIDLDAFTLGCDSRMRDVLDERERQRAERMATPMLRRRYVAAHAATRWLLAEVLEVEPRNLVFDLGAHGKPAVSQPADAGLHFNLSHCQGRALLAVADSEVGVDIEGWIERDTLLLAAEVLAADELAHFQGVPMDQQPRELAHAWAAKEALFKACGLGLQIAPGAVRVETGLGWHRLPEATDGSAWWLQSIDVDGPFCACLATRGAVAVDLTKRP